MYIVRLEAVFLHSALKQNLRKITRIISVGNSSTTVLVCIFCGSTYEIFSNI
jgi:hypothetical protein